MNSSRICLVALLLHTKELKKFIGSDKYVQMMEQVENVQTILFLDKQMQSDTLISKNVHNSNVVHHIMN